MKISDSNLLPRGSAGGRQTEPAHWEYHWKRLRHRLLEPLVDWRDRVMFGPRMPVRPNRHDVSARVPTGAPPFFILGSPRSGTTLLRQMINRHPEVFIPPENGEIQGMVRTFGRLRHSPWPDVVRAVLDRFACGYEAPFWEIDLQRVAERANALAPLHRSLAGIFGVLYSEYGRQHAPGKRRWGDKSTPGHFQYLNKLDYVFPDARFVHIIRDGRDSVLSCVRTGFYDGSYVKAAHAWTENVRACDRFGRRCGPGRFLSIRYEDLVDSPPLLIKHICGFLGIEFTPAMTSDIVDRRNLSGDVIALPHHRNVLQPVSSASVGNWRSALPSQSQSVVTSIMRGELRSHGYELT